MSIQRWLPLLLVGVTCVPAQAGDWSTYRHDIRRTGYTDEQLKAQQLGQAWTYRAPTAPITAWTAPARWDAYAYIRGLRAMRNYDAAFHVAVVGQSVYFGSSVEDALLCVDARTGKTRWLFHTDAPVRVAPTVVDGRVYFGCDDGHAYCISAKDGKLLWKVACPGKHPRVLNNGKLISLWPCRTGVLVDNGTAYFGFSMLPWRPSYLCAVDARTGKATGKGHYIKALSGETFEGMLLASDRQLVVLRGRIPPTLFARDTGKNLGSLGGGGGSFATLSPDGNILHHGPGNKTGWTSVSDLRTRKHLKLHKGRTAVVHTPAVSYWLSDTQLTAVDEKTQKTLWDVPCAYPNDIIVAGDTVFVAGRDEVAGFACNTGKRIWRAPVEGKAHGLAVADGALFVSTDLGVVHCFRPGGKKATFPKAPAVSTPPGENSYRPVRVTDKALLGRWVFHSGMSQWARRRGMKNPEQVVPDLTGKNHGTILGKARLQRVGAVEALEQDGATNSVRVVDNHTTMKVPTREITAEAWVRVDKPHEWGGILCVAQDNGNYERGFVLGYRQSHFSFAVAAGRGNTRLLYLKARTPFVPGRWYHVVGTFDGATHKVYVNGKLEAQSTRQKGNINYPPQAFVEIGAYHDVNEYYRLAGMIHEVRLYERALSDKEVAANYEAKRKLFPQSSSQGELALGPYAEFTQPGTAVIRYQTHRPSPTLLLHGAAQLTQRIEDKKPKKTHEVTIKGLARARLYRYQIHTRRGKQVSVSPEFELDTHFDYSHPPFPEDLNPFPAQRRQRYTALAQHILTSTNVRQGICLVLGCSSGQLAYELARVSKLRIICVDTRKEKVEQLRKILRQAGIYGNRVSVHHVRSLGNLPFVGEFANLVVSEALLDEGTRPGTSAEIMRLLRPEGGMAYLGQDRDSTGNKLSPQELKRWVSVSAKKHTLQENDLGLWVQFTRDTVEGAGVWSHQYGQPDNSAFGGETLAGSRAITDLRVQWVGRPGPRAQPDRSGRKPSPLSIKGRLYVQGYRRMIAMDSYNGTLLWNLEIPPFQRMNVPRDCGNWCADEKHLFAVIRNRCWQIDGQTGKVVRFLPVIPGPRKDWRYDWGYIGWEGEHLIGSAVKEGSSYTDFWGNANQGWYDAASGPATHKVCSDNLFALDRASGQHQWTYSKGVIVNSTITMARNRIYFIECRNPRVLAQTSRRLGGAHFWKDQYMVALDRRTGKTIWEKPVKTPPGVVVFYLAHGRNRLVLVSSASGKYHVHAFEDRTGDAVWQQQFSWPGGKSDHGKAMSRPAIVGNRVFVRPMGYDLRRGTPLAIRMPAGGCGTYAATTNMFVFRRGNITMWDPLSQKATAWSRLRPGCWLSTIPAGGMLLSPEAGGGCSCGSWMETSLGFMPIRKGAK